MATNPWLLRPGPNPRAALRLFCFPYAGGSANIFHSWPQGLPASVEVCAVQLPGRGSRLLETPFTNLNQLVRAAAEALLPHLSEPFALFGHSMGARICFEFTRHLEKEHGIKPTHLFVSGCRAPQIPDTEPPIYDLPEPEFLEELRELSGTPQEVLDHPELMQLMLPLLRADFEVAQTYSCPSVDEPLDRPVTVFGGLQDEDITREHLEAWRALTSGPFSLYMFPGDHFFINTSRSLLLRRLAVELAQDISDRR